MTPVLKKLADIRKNDSLAVRLRRKRFALFLSLIRPLPRPLTILDVGGTQRFWETMGFADERDTEITLLNLEKAKVSHPNFTSIIGDGRDLRRFKDGQFDVVFSNSVIEHVATFEEQQRMAREIVRAGKMYFVQTPNRYFPIEPHFLVPFFQFFPLRLQIFLITHFRLGWYRRLPDKREAAALARSIRLLTEREFRALFPEAHIRKEKLLGVTKSFVAYGRQHAVSRPAGRTPSEAVRRRPRSWAEIARSGPAARPGGLL
jgi:SAM-dependent methyltransferase